MPDQFTFYNDPGHGWLAVTPEQSRAVGLLPDHYSPFSYYLAPRPGFPSGLLLLEEDVDAGLFFRAAGYNSTNNRPDVRDVYADPIRFGRVALRDLPHLSGRLYQSPSDRSPDDAVPGSFAFADGVSHDD